MKPTVWRTLLGVALLSIVFVALPVSAAVTAPEKVTQPSHPAYVVDFDLPVFPSVAVVTSTVNSTNIGNTYTLTYTAVLTNTSSTITLTNPAFTYTLDSALRMLSVDMSISGAAVSTGTVVVPGTVVLPGGTTVVPGTIILPGGTIVPPGEDPGYPQCDTFPGENDAPCTVFLPGGTTVIVPAGTVLTPGGTVILPGGTVVDPGNLVYPEGCTDYLPGTAQCTVLVPGGTVSWWAPELPPDSVITMTLVTIDDAIYPHQVKTTFTASADGAVLPPTPIEHITDILSTAQGSAALRVIASGPKVAKRGDIITYTLAFSNVGDMPAYNVRMTDTLPVGVEPLAGVQTAMFVPVAPPDTIFSYEVPVRVTMQGVTLVNHVSVTAIGLQLNSIVGNSASWETTVAKIYAIYLPVVRRE